MADTRRFNYNELKKYVYEALDNAIENSDDEFMELVNNHKIREIIIDLYKFDAGVEHFLDGNYYNSFLDIFEIVGSWLDEFRRS